MSYLVAAAAALVPGVAAWAMGRQLVSAPDDATAAARWTQLVARAGIIFGLLLLAIFVSGVPFPALWFVGSFVLLLVGLFPARRAMRGETWGVGGFLAQEFR